MAYVIPYRGCKIHITGSVWGSVWEGGKEFASYDVKGVTAIMKTALTRGPLKGKALAVKALETAKRQVDDLLSKGK